ncbi:zinc-binding dehydrogenase (plasmid) [Rhodococcus sp. USK10]|nr:zinc-binding dehydrogenase [Rhodococcus sp. USK10]
MSVPAKRSAAMLVGPGELVIEEHPIPEVRDRDVLVKVDRGAICGSDLHAVYDGLGFLVNQHKPEPGGPGHEGVGTVVETRSERFQVGDRVLILNVGSFAEYTVVSEDWLLTLPEDQSFARMIMAQQLGVCLYGMDRFWPRDREAGKVATLIGAGSIGLNFLQLLKLWGFETVIVSDLEPARLDVARELGATEVVLAPAESVVEMTRKLTGGLGADLVVEAAGYDETRAQSVEAVREDGRIGFFGYPESYEPSPFPFGDAFWKGPISIEIVKGAQRIKGLPHFHEAIKLISDGTIPVDHLLGAEYPLDEIATAFEAARARKHIKVQLVV